MTKNKKCQGLETFQRLNYLIQIRDFMAINIQNTSLSTYYGNLIDNIAKKSVLRIDPIIKKQICKKCKNILLPGISADVKVKSFTKYPIVKWKCKQCNLIKKYPVDRNKKLWSERQESIVEF